MPTLMADPDASEVAATTWPLPSGFPLDPPSPFPSPLPLIAGNLTALCSKIVLQLKLYFQKKLAEEKSVSSLQLPSPRSAWFGKKGRGEDGKFSVLVSGMYKNQLQELAQRSCFNLPSYACVREGPDHAPRFKASVNFNGEIFQGPSQCTTLRQAEHAAAEVALTNLSSRAPSRSLAARVLDETGVYKNLLQETTHRAGLKLPIYTTVRSGPGHQPVFTSTVDLAGMCIAGEPAKTKKQAEKNAAMAAWSALKQMPDLESFPRPKADAEAGGGCGGEDQDQLVRYLSNFKPKEENKQARQTEHYQQQLQKQRRKAVGCFINEGTSSPVSPRRSSMFQQQWRSLDHLPDFPLINSSQLLKKKPFFLASALSTGPQVLPQFQEHFSSNEKLSNSPNSRSIVGSSLRQATSPEFQTLLDGKLLERVNHMAGVHRFADPNSSAFASPACSPPLRLNSPVEAAPARNSSSFPLPRILNTGGFRSRSIAPAVQIRSVIPVCAAPPMQQPQPPGSSRPPAIPKEETDDDISAATSKINKLQL